MALALGTVITLLPIIFILLLILFLIILLLFHYVTVISHDSVNSLYTLIVQLLSLSLLRFTGHLRLAIMDNPVLFTFLTFLFVIQIIIDATLFLVGGIILIVNITLVPSLR